MKTIITSEPVTDRSSQPVCNGSLKFELEGHGVLKAGGHVLAIPVHASLDADGKIQGELRLHGCDEMQYGGANYRISVYTAGGNLAREAVDVRVASDGETFDLAKAVNSHRSL